MKGSIAVFGGRAIDVRVSALAVAGGVTSPRQGTARADHDQPLSDARRPLSYIPEWSTRKINR